MEQRALKIENNCLNTNIYSYLETSGGQSSNLYSNVVHYFSTSVDKTSVEDSDSCFLALVSNTCCSIVQNYDIQQNDTHQKYIQRNNTQLNKKMLGSASRVIILSVAW